MSTSILERIANILILIAELLIAKQRERLENKDQAMGDIEESLSVEHSGKHIDPDLIQFG